PARSVSGEAEPATNASAAGAEAVTVPAPRGSARNFPSSVPRASSVAEPVPGVSGEPIGAAPKRTASDPWAGIVSGADAGRSTVETGAPMASRVLGSSANGVSPEFETVTERAHDCPALTTDGATGVVTARRAGSITSTLSGASGIAAAKG